MTLASSGISAVHRSIDFAISSPEKDNTHRLLAKSIEKMERETGLEAGCSA